MPTGAQSAAAQDLSRQLAQLAQELETVKQRLASLEANLGPLPQPQPAPEQGPQAAAGQPPTDEPNRPLEPANASARSAPETEMSPPMPAATASTSEAAPAPASHPTPWMMQSPDEPAQRVPRWTQWTAEFLQSVDSQAERVLDGMPATIATEGHLEYGTQIRRWIASDRPLLGHVARLLARRLVATKRSERRSKEQQLRLADWVVLDVLPGLPSADPTEKARRERYLSSNTDKLKLLSVCLLFTVGAMEGPPE